MSYSIKTLHFINMLVYTPFFLHGLLTIFQKDTRSKSRSITDTLDFFWKKRKRCWKILGIVRTLKQKLIKPSCCMSRDHFLARLRIFGVFSDVPVKRVVLLVFFTSLTLAQKRQMCNLGMWYWPSMFGLLCYKTT